MVDMLLKYKKFSEDFASELILHDDVEGIMFLGGVARNIADEYSDIDIAVFSNGSLDWFSPEDKVLNNGYELDTFHIDMVNGFSDWSEIKKEAYSEGIIYHDRSGKVKEFLGMA